MDASQVETSYGKVSGARSDGVSIFKGVPYAGRISGDRRFRRPAELEPWAGVREALHLGAPAIQPPRRNEPEPAEDCLYLHGSGFVIGSGGSPERFVASHNMAALWTSFARTGRPAAEGVPEWPAYTLDGRASLRIDTRCEVMYDRYGAELAMWRAAGWL